MKVDLDQILSALKAMNLPFVKKMEKDITVSVFFLHGGISFKLTVRDNLTFCSRPLSGHSYMDENQTAELFDVLQTVQNVIQSLKSQFAQS